MAHILPEPVARETGAPEFPPKRAWAGLQPNVPGYDDPGFDKARRAWLAWWEFGKAMGFAEESR